MKVNHYISRTPTIRKPLVYITPLCFITIRQRQTRIKPYFNFCFSDLESRYIHHVISFNRINSHHIHLCKWATVMNSIAINLNNVFFSPCESVFRFRAAGSRSFCLTVMYHKRLSQFPLALLSELDTRLLSRQKTVRCVFVSFMLQSPFTDRVVIHINRPAEPSHRHPITQTLPIKCVMYILN